MSRQNLTIIAVVIAAGATTGVDAQQRTTPTRTLGPVVSRTTTPVKSAYSIRPLSDGRVLVSDYTSREVRLFDASLTTSTLIADTANATSIPYGRAALPLIRYSGDSTILVDNTSFSLLVLDGNGKVARVMAAPRPTDLPMIANVSSAVDGRGRLIYRGRIQAPMRPPTPGQPFVPPQQPDSGPILRADFETRTVDTLTYLRIPKTVTVSQDMPGGGRRTSGGNPPIASVDDFVIMSDGTIAILRAQDYHVDWIESDGDRASTPKMQFDWRRLTDEEKQRIIDSAATAQAERAAKLADQMLAGGTPGGADGAKRAEGEVAAVKMAVSAAGASGVGERVAVSSAALTPEMLTALRTPLVVKFSPSDLPDYYPPIRLGMLRADLDGNVWVLPTTSALANGGGLLYDVVNRKGEIVERVQLPPNRTILGFGPGVVYLGVADEKGTFIERVKIAGGSVVQQ
ncbi:MAG TPA: hypothetical protein VJR92_05660 [Gemmatimonadaceae bacterium]|nr:hypothetical protein [Gemmatimonadaceae bacterium]